MPNRVVIRTITAEEYRELAPIFNGPSKSTYCHYSASQEHMAGVRKRIRASIDAEKRR